MGSIIRSISFKNFYNFYGDYSENCYQFCEGLNIVSADNGMGKSKIFNGFLWVITGQVYDADEKRKVNASSTPLKLLSDKAKLNTEASVAGVKIVFDYDNKRYEVTKSIRYKKLTSNPSTSDVEDWDILDARIDMSCTDLISNNTITIYSAEEQEKIIQNGIISPDMQSYALLQGEAIENIVDLSNARRLAATVEVLTDIGDIKSIEQSCQQLVKQAGKDLQSKQNAHANDQREFKELKNKKEKLEEHIDRCKESRDTYQTELETAKVNYDNLLSQVANTEKRVEYREKIKKIGSDIKRLVNERDRLLSSVNDNLFKQNMPWILLGTSGYVDRYIELRDKYTEECIARKVISNPDAYYSSLPEGSPDDGSLKMMLQKGRCFVCGRPAEKGTKEWQHIESVLNRSKQREDNAQGGDLHEFFGEIQKSVTQLTNVDSIFTDVAIIRLRQNELEKKISELKEDLKTTNSDFFNYGGTDSSKDSEKDDNLLNRFERSQDDKKKYAGLVASADKAIAEAQEEIRKIDNEMKRCGGTDVPVEYSEMKEIVEDVRDIFANVKERIYDEVITTLEKNANYFYQELTKGNAVYGGHLKFERTSYESIDIKPVDIRGNLLTEASEGFQRMKKVAIVMAIISSKIGDKHFVYPFIADAPFSAYGKNFINNFLASVPSVFNQSIILIKELYDVNSDKLITNDGQQILDKMKDGQIKGSFYVNFVINDEGAILVDGRGDRLTQTTKISTYKKASVL